MSRGTISNAANTPLTIRTGTVPDVSGALEDWMQPMSFQQLVKTVEGFQAVENTAPLDFFGVIQPLNSRTLLMKPEGQRAWTWLLLHADPSLRLNVDDVVVYLGVQTRVMGRKNNSIYGYIEYELVQDWTGAGPTALYDGGDLTEETLNPNLDGGEARLSGPGNVSGGNADGD